MADEKGGLAEPAGTEALEAALEASLSNFGSVEADALEQAGLGELLLAQPDGNAFSPEGQPGVLAAPSSPLPVSPGDQARIRAQEAAVRRDPDSATPLPQRPSFPRKRSRDGRLLYSENSLSLAEALTGHRGERALQVLAGIVEAYHGDAQRVLDSVPDELPDWARA